MTEYIKKLVDEKDDSNSKIFLAIIFGLLAVVLFLALIIMLIFGITLPLSVPIGCAGISLSFAGVSATERIKLNKDDYGSDDIK